MPTVDAPAFSAPIAQAGRQLRSLAITSDDEHGVGAGVGAPIGIAASIGEGGVPQWSLATILRFLGLGVFAFVAMAVAAGWVGSERRVQSKPDRADHEAVDS